MDPKEKKERVAAAKAMTKEDEAHYVSFIQDCIDVSDKATRDIRRVQAKCWRAYNEEEPEWYAEKESWQSRTVVPRPFAAVQYGASAIKKAFSPDFLSIEDKQNPDGAEFWQQMMKIQTDNLHGDFVNAFIKALMMSMAVGVSMEIIPKFLPQRGLIFELIEPWKIKRDPDAPSEDPQGGMYWIHQEWMDWWMLRDGEKRGMYKDIDRISSADDDTENPDDPFMTREAIARRKDQIWERSDFRKMVLVSEFWGMILDKKGEVILPSATMTMAGGRIIQAPEAVPYRRLRWPGVSFSPLPNLLRHGGRGLLQGITSIWEAMNNLMCLHEDALKWIVMPPSEINIDALEDPADVECWPGKNYLVRDTANGQQAVRTVDRRDVTNSVLANMQYYDQNFQRGSFVPDAVQGLPGYRQDMTYRESAMNLDQAMGAYALMGASVEKGAVQALTAARDVVASFAGLEDYVSTVGERTLFELGVLLGADKAGNVTGLPELTGSFSVSGIQALLKDQETLSNIKTTVIPMADSPRFGKYIRPYRVLKAIETRVNLKDEKVFVDEETGDALEAQEAAQAEMPPAPPLGVPPSGGEPGDM